MGYDFDRLKTTHCFDAITLRVPARWQCGPDPELEGYWCCCEPDEDDETGTLWIHVDMFRMPEEAVAAFDHRAQVEDTVAHVIGKGPPLQESTIEEAPEGYLWRRVYDDVDGGELLRFTRYTLFQQRGREAVITDFNLVLEMHQVDDPEFRGLLDTMDREIRAARVDRFTRPEGHPLAATGIFNFADQVKVVLPESVRARPDDEIGNRWYCWFEDDALPARLWVSTIESRIQDEDGDDVTVPEKLYTDLLLRYVDDDDDPGRDLARLPTGAFSYEIYDDATEGDDNRSAETDDDDADGRDGPRSSPSFAG